MQEQFKTSSRKGRHQWCYPAEFKRRVVEESFASSAPVKLVARRNAISASVLYKWRLAHISASSHLNISGSVDDKRTDSISCAEAGGLLPIHVVDELSLQSAAAVPDHPRDEYLCVVEFDRARLGICGEVSPSMLQVLIQELSR